MRLIAFALSICCLLGGCTAVDKPQIGVVPTVSPSEEPSFSREEVDIYAAVIESMVEDMNRFPFKRLYVVDGPVEGAGDPMSGFQRSTDAFSEPMKQALVERLDGLPPIGFIARAEEFQLGRNGMDGVKHHGVIITLGPIRRRSATRFHVGHSQWCGGLCGEWATSVVENIDGKWEVTGTTGPVSIS
ncbi:MAG: hypothetical protein QOG16_1632 [Actinomycetota bacterium]|jgi:hypothetical protein|nr:hypothetical protein [Actinomycetota bacterium]